MKSLIFITILVYLSTAAIVYVPTGASNGAGYTDCYFCILSGGNFCATSNTGTVGTGRVCATTFNSGECTSIFTTLAQCSTTP